MKKQIFNLFTLENGIRLSAPVLDYISDHFTEMESVNTLLKLCKAKFNTSSLSMEQLMEISLLKTKETTQFELRKFKYMERNFAKSFQALRDRLGVTPHPISSLCNDTVQVIFGVFFKGINGQYSLEDDHDTIELELSKVENACFVFENMFVGLRGFKTDIFNVVEVILPRFPVFSPLASFSRSKSPKVCVVGCLKGELSVLRSLILAERPDLCIVSSMSDINMAELDGVCENVIVCASRDCCDYVPFGLNGVSNPFFIEIGGNLLGFIDYNLFEHRRDGIFFNSSSMEAFIRSLISQGSICPFSGSDFPTACFPNFLIVSQDSHPVVVDVDGVKVMSISPIKDGYFGVLDFAESSFDVRMVQ